MQVGDPHARIREATEGGADVLGEDPRAITETARRQAAVDQRRPFAADLEAHQTRAGLGLEPLDQKPAAPRPDLELDGV